MHNPPATDSRIGAASSLSSWARNRSWPTVADQADGAHRRYADGAGLYRDPAGFEAVSALHAGARTLLAVPDAQGGQLIGGIPIYRQEVRPFTDKQIALVTNFAAQAVIAIENTRLLNELRARRPHRRTAELTESLEQQTATSEVLKVISQLARRSCSRCSTPCCRSASRLCDADFGNYLPFEGERMRIVAALSIRRRPWLSFAGDHRFIRWPSVRCLMGRMRCDQGSGSCRRCYGGASLRRTRAEAVAAVELGGMRTFCLCRC